MAKTQIGKSAETVQPNKPLLKLVRTGKSTISDAEWARLHEENLGQLVEVTWVGVGGKPRVYDVSVAEISKNGVLDIDYLIPFIGEGQRGQPGAIAKITRDIDGKKETIYEDERLSKDIGNPLKVQQGLVRLLRQERRNLQKPKGT
jgi:hypothetical protein